MTDKYKDISYEDLVGFLEDTLYESRIELSNAVTDCLAYSEDDTGEDVLDWVIQTLSSTTEEQSEDCEVVKEWVAGFSTDLDGDVTNSFINVRDIYRKIKGLEKLIEALK